MASRTQELLGQYLDTMPFNSGEDIHAIDRRRERYLDEVKALKSEEDIRDWGRQIIFNREYRAWTEKFASQGVTNANKILAASGKLKAAMEAPPALAMKGDLLGAGSAKHKDKDKTKSKSQPLPAEALARALAHAREEADDGILPPEPSSSLGKDEMEISRSCGSAERAYRARLNGDALMTRTLPGIPHEDYRLMIMKMARKISTAPTTKDFALAKAQVDKQLVDRGLGVVIPHAKPGRVTR
jgi:hypothetical protein